jgi:erythromycin esterase-like protein
MRITAALPYYIYSTKLASKQLTETPATPPTTPAETPVHYDSTAAAVRALLDDADPRVLAFGEFHPCTDPPAYKTAKAYFAEEVLQVLKDEGIMDLIIEQILNDPAIIAELDAFYNDNTLAIGQTTTPTLWRTFEFYTDRQDLINLLNKARELGIRVHPGGMTLAQAAETIHNSEYNSSNRALRDELHLRAWNYTDAAGRAAVDHFLEGTGRVAIYNGAKHHNLISPRIFESEGGTNYGEYLSQRLGQDYMEVELYPVDGLRTLTPFRQEYHGVPNLQEVTPENGVNLLNRGQSHILLIN